MNFRLRTILLLLLPCPLLAQQPPSTPPTLQLDVTVNGRNGKPISGLTQSNFTVLDNGATQHILNFHAVQTPSTDPPVQVILLIDTVNAPFTTVSFERDEIAKFLRRSGPTLPYPLSFVFFANTDTKMQHIPSRSTDALLKELTTQVNGLRTIGRNTGIYGAAERAQLSLTTMSQLAAYEQKVPGRKLLIWVSPGWAYLSGVRIYLTPRDQNQLFSAIVGISDALERARITLYSVDPLGVAGSGFRSNYYQEFLKGVKASKDVQNGNLALQVLAQHSGGKVLYAGNDIAAEIAECFDDASAFYVLTVPRVPADSAITFHSIKVNLPDTSLKARTLFGYYAEPSTAPPADPH
jgi:VWFA-related protein